VEIIKEVESHCRNCEEEERKLKILKGECTALLRKHPADALPDLIKLTKRIHLAVGDQELEGITPENEQKISLAVNGGCGGGWSSKYFVRSN